MQQTSILLVDDDEACLDSLKWLLVADGYHAETADNTVTTLSIAERQSFDLLITDFEMPNMNGIDLFLGIRRIHPEIEGILFTGALTDTLRTHATKVGMLSALNKPCDCAALLPLVESIPSTAGRKVA